MINKPILTAPVKPEFIYEYTALDNQAWILSPRAILTLKPYEDTPPNAPHITAPNCVSARYFKHLLFTAAIQAAPAQSGTEVELIIQAILSKAEMNPNGTFNETQLKDPTIIGETNIPLLTKNVLTLPPNFEPHIYTKYGYGTMELFTGIPESHLFRITLIARMQNINTSTTPTNNKFKLLISGF